MHHLAFDQESRTIAIMEDYLKEKGYVTDFNQEQLRLHHEIYLSDARRISPEMENRNSASYQKSIAYRYNLSPDQPLCLWWVSTFSEQGTFAPLYTKGTKS